MKAEREDAAKIVYAAMQELMPLGKEYPWVEGGNSNAQAEARRAAAKLPLLTPAHSAVIAAAKVMAHLIRQAKTSGYHEYLSARDGLLNTVAALRELEGTA